MRPVGGVHLPRLQNIDGDKSVYSTSSFMGLAKHRFDSCSTAIATGLGVRSPICKAHPSPARHEQDKAKKVLAKFERICQTLRFLSHVRGVFRRGPAAFCECLLCSNGGGGGGGGRGVEGVGVRSPSHMYRN